MRLSYFSCYTISITNLRGWNNGATRSNNRFTERASVARYERRIFVRLLTKYDTRGTIWYIPIRNRGACATNGRCKEPKKRKTLSERESATALMRIDD